MKGCDRSTLFSLCPFNIWADALDTFFLKDTDLIDYVQRMVGLSTIGKVYVEALIIAYGEGRNGKSTFWNVIARVLGTYSGNISADMLTVECRRNVNPELAEAKGKRMLIAAELEEGMRLNTVNVKQLCSMDEIYAEKKYPADFCQKCMLKVFPIKEAVRAVGNLRNLGGGTENKIRFFAPMVW